MTIQVALHHKTRYSFDRPVSLSPHEIRLRPAAHCRTPILSYSLKVQPAKHFLNWQQDAYGNWVARYVFPEKARELVDRGRPGRRHDGDQPVRLLRRGVTPRTIRSPTPSSWRASWRRSARWSRPGRCWRRGSSAFKRELLQRRAMIIGRPAGGAEPAAAARRAVHRAPGAGRLHARRRRSSCKQGSCRDSGWLLVQILRHLGIAARFVSGYLIQLTADVKALDGPSGPETRLHRPARLGRGLSSRAPAGSASTRPRG